MSLLPAAGGGDKRLTSAQNAGVTNVSSQFSNMSGCWTYDGFGNRTL